MFLKSVDNLAKIVLKCFFVCIFFISSSYSNATEKKNDIPMSNIKTNPPQRNKLKHNLQSSFYLIKNKTQTLQHAILVINIKNTHKQQNKKKE